MEPGEIDCDNDAMDTFFTFAARAAQADCLSSPSASSSAKKGKGNDQNSVQNNTSPSVSSCFVFKSRLQEYAQRAGLTTPIYETIKTGPSHEPSFRSTVVFNNVRYDSLPGFYNRKAAEQSAAEVALIELSKSVDIKFGISLPVHETGLCKNLLQEYSQKMNFAMPLYESFKDEKQGRASTYYCVVEIGGIKYIGGSANTKKEAEIKAARTALLAIQSAPTAPEDFTGNSVYTVLPQKKESDLGISTQETAAALKPKKGRFNKKKQHWRKRRGMHNFKKCTSRQGNMAGGTGVKLEIRDGVEFGATDSVLNSQHHTSDALRDKIDAVTSEIERAGGAEENVDIRARQDFGVTNSVSFRGTDSRLAAMPSTTDISNTGFHNGNLEHTLIPFDRPHKDGESTSKDVDA